MGQDNGCLIGERTSKEKKKAKTEMKISDAKAITHHLTHVEWHPANL